MSEEFKLDLKDVPIDQLGYIYKDIENQAKIMEKTFHMPSFSILPPNTQVVKYRGKDSEITTKIAMTRMFNLQIELIQWIEGDCVFKEFIDAGREGLQHVSIFFKSLEDMEPYMDDFRERGYNVVHSGNIGNRYFYYFDTMEVLGFMFEIQASKRKRKSKK